ncbi:MAG: galactokinase family protein [Clostridiaceae bacterium]|nr:galactokinase family protein [Clostridiaceae bacterium]
MANTALLREELRQGKYDDRLRRVYVSDEEIKAQYDRYCSLADDFDEIFSADREVRMFSAPGRTEVGGNHTDHNHGRVLAASINLDAIALASKNDDNTVRVKSKGYAMDVVELSDLSVHDSETGHSPALVRGVMKGFKNYGYNIGGFDAVTASRVLSGSGLSSSAAYEVLVGTMVNYLYNDGKVDPVTIAKIAQYAENEYFGKPCGLMDQMACSVGSFITIDFKNPAQPYIEKVDFDFASCGHSLCIVDTKGSHSNLTDEYAAIRIEMEKIANQFGKDVLREVDEERFLKEIPELRKKVGDRAVLRAIHFYNDNKRVIKEVEALKAKDFEAFKQFVIESGASSYMYNQNVFAPKQPDVQPVSLALAISESVLKGKGAWRVHGGGFAGTIQAFVPNELLSEYKTRIEEIFGEGSCYVLSVRPVGGAEI